MEAQTNNPEATPKPKIDWKADDLQKFLESTGSFDSRQLKEMQLATAYDTFFDHGTDGHSRLKLIARLVNFISWMRMVSMPLDDPGLKEYLDWRAANSVPDPLR